MEILEAFALTNSYRAAGLLAGCSHHTVEHWVTMRDNGLLPDGVTPPERPKLIDAFMPKVEEWVERSNGRVRGDVVFDKLVADGLFYKGSAGTKLWNTVNSIGNEMEPVKAIHHHLIEGRAGGAFFLVAMHMKIPVIGATIGETMNQRGITVVGEYDRLITREQPIKFLIA